MWYYKDKLLGMYYNILFLAYFFTPNFLTIIIMAHYRNPIMSYINALFVYSFGVYCIYALQCTHTSHNCNQLGKKRYTISSMCVFCSQLELASQSLHSYKAHNVRICLVVLHSTYILHIVYIELSINGKQEQGRHPGDCASSLPQGRRNYIF